MVISNYDVQNVDESTELGSCQGVSVFFGAVAGVRGAIPCTCKRTASDEQSVGGQWKT